MHRKKQQYLHITSGNSRHDDASITFGKTEANIGLFPRGAPPQYDWEAYEAALEEKIYGTTEENPGEGWPDRQNVSGWQHLVDVVKWIQQQAQRGKNKKCPSESTTRFRAKQMLERLKNKRGMP